MRDEDEGTETTYDNPHKPGIQKSFNARCTESNSATNASDGVNYAVGTMVWTLFDYYGEPPVGGATGDGEVSSTYGQYDLCGFPKAAAFWCAPTCHPCSFFSTHIIAQVPNAVAHHDPGRAGQDVLYAWRARGPAYPRTAAPPRRP